MWLHHRFSALLAVAVYAGSGAWSAENKPVGPSDRAAVENAAARPKTLQPVQGTANGSKEDPQRWWRGNCKRIESDIKKMDGKIDIALVGDSITARWKGDTWQKHWGAYRAVNMGIGGDQIQNVLWRLENGELDGYKARLFIVMIGTNNLWDRKADPADVAAGIKAILDLIRSKHPESELLLLSIFPTGDKPNPGREKRTAVNNLISGFADGKAVHYMDIAAKFLEPDGTISKEVMPDFLHLSPKGYDIWAEAISGKVKELLSGDKSAPQTPAQT